MNKNPLCIVSPNWIVECTLSFFCHSHLVFLIIETLKKWRVYRPGEGELPEQNPCLIYLTDLFISKSGFQLNLIGDIKSVETEIEGILHCDKCREISGYLFEQHYKFHTDQELLKKSKMFTMEVMKRKYCFAVMRGK